MMASKISLPMPGRANNVSVITAPETSAPASRPSKVSSGTAALGSACTQATRRGEAPRARALRTQGSRRAASMLAAAWRA